MYWRVEIIMKDTLTDYDYEPLPKNPAGHAGTIQWNAHRMVGSRYLGHSPVGIREINDRRAGQ